MNGSCRIFRAGTRGSPLARRQTDEVLRGLEARLPAVRFEAVALTTPGDRDLVTDLRTSPTDFFTRDLDEAVLRGDLDVAIHSAKDLPDPMPEGLDWAWLPGREDPRDAWILPLGQTWDALPECPVIGVSSERREAYALRQFPNARLQPLRGAIEARLAQLDAGAFDLILMAGAALHRLVLSERVSRWISEDELPVPDGQGVLAMTFRAGDARLQRIRSLAVRAVTFVGAGAGSAEACTVAGIHALRRAEVCLHDALMDPALLDELPRAAQRVDVGKRCGQHRATQEEINRLLTMYARRGLRVVRLKGGDPGFFGRLAEEVDALEALALPYRVLPGISSLQAATTGTGMLLTRRGVSRGFCVMTPRRQGGGAAPVDRAARVDLPIVFFMAAEQTAARARELLDDGQHPATPAALVYDAGGEGEAVLREALGVFAQLDASGELPAAARALAASLAPHQDKPGLFVVGAVAAYGYARTHGALAGRRVLLTCSEALLAKARDAVRDLGGVPVDRPLVRLTACPEARTSLSRMASFDWLALTSPSAVRCLAEILREGEIDLRALPRLMVCGPGTAAELFRVLGVRPDLQPEGAFSAEALIRLASGALGPGARVLRLRSDLAGPALAGALRGAGAQVEDVVLYRNEAIAYEGAPPTFDSVFFASASAVDAFVALWGRDAAGGKTIVALGGPTARALERHGLRADVMAGEATVESAVAALAAHGVNAALAAD